MMNGRTFAAAAFILGLLASGAGTAQAQVDSYDPDNDPWGWATDESICASGTLTSCVDFTLWKDTDGYYYFQVLYTGDDGYMTAAGIYDRNGGDNWAFGTPTLLEPGTTGWVVGSDDDCEDMSGGGDVLFTGCVTNPGNPSDGAGDGQYITFRFTTVPDISDGDIWTGMNEGDLGLRARVRGVGEEDCSYKLDSPQGVVSGCGGEVVPEPMTVILLATGLVGIGAVGYRNRRKEEDEVA